MDDGSAALPYQRRDGSRSIEIQVGDGAKPFAATQRIRIRYRFIGTLTSRSQAEEFFWNVRGEEPFAVIKAASITITAPSLQGAQCGQVPVDITARAIDCLTVTSSSTSVQFATTLELGAPVGLTIWADLTKGSVIVQPLDRGADTGTSIEPATSAEEKGLKIGTVGISLGAGVLLLALLVMWRRASDGNSPRRFGIVWLAVADLLIVSHVILVVGGTGFEEWEWAPVELVFAIVLALSAVATGIMYVRRGGQLDAIRSGEKLLAHWVYSHEDWLAYAQGEQETRRAEGKGRLSMAVIVVAVVLIASYFIGQGDEGAGPSFFTIALAVSAAVLVIVVAANYLYLALADPRRVRTAEAWISLDGVYLQGVLTTWSRGESLLGDVAALALGFSGNKLNGVQLTPGTPYLLEFAYSWWNQKAGVQSTTLRVPVPAGQEAWAQNIVAEFSRDREPLAV